MSTKPGMTTVPLTTYRNLVEDNARLEWLIANGYVPAAWRPWDPSAGPAGNFPNGMVQVGPGSRATIDAARKR
jgi:hypothetical protein